ncbi:MAG: hypothetical protein WCG20_01025 [bacterium]
MESPKVQFNKNSEERRKRRTKFLFVALLLLVIMIVGIIGFLRKESFQVTGVEVSGARALSTRDIIQKAKEDFSGNYAWVIPRSNILLFSKRSVKSQLLEQFPGIESLDISFKDKNTVSIVVHEKEPTDIWCKTTDDCYFIDDTGLIYKPSPAFSSGVYVTFTGNTLELPTDVIRARFISVTLFSKLRTIIQQLQQYPVSVTGVHLDSEGDIALRIDRIKTYTLGAMTELLITDQVDMQTIIDNLTILTNDKTFTNGLIAKGSDLETIDFRFPAKIYYKFKNGAAIPSESSTTTQP